MFKFNDNATGPDDMWIEMTPEENAEVIALIVATTPTA